jgi:hypothetical protein
MEGMAPKLLPHSPPLHSKPSFPLKNNPQTYGHAQSTMGNPPFSGMIDGYLVNLFHQFTQHYTPTTYPQKPESPM